MAEDGRIVYKVMCDTSEVASQAKRGGEEGGSFFEQAMTGAARRVGEAFVEMAAKAGQAVKSFIEDSIRVGMDFESSMSQIAATLGYSTQDIANNVNGAGDAFEALKNKAKEMGSATNYTATQAAEGLNILAMSGYNAEQSIDMIEDVLHLAAAGSMDLASAAGYVSGAMKGFADETKKSTYYADLMAKGATLANTNVQQLGDALSGSAATAKSYGQSADSVTIALLRLAEQGETGSAAATALSAAMKNLYAPTDQAKKALDSLGVQAFDPTTGKARDFNQVVNELNAALNATSADGVAKYTDAQRTAYAQTIFGIQGFDAYNKMVVTSTEKQQEWAEAIATATGEAAQQYDTMTDNLQGDVDIFNSALDGMKLAIYESLQPALRDLAKEGTDTITTLTKAFEEDGVRGLTQAAADIASGILDRFIAAAPDMLNAGLDLLISLVNGIARGLPSLVSKGMELVQSLAQTLINRAPEIVQAGVNLLTSLVNGLSTALPTLLKTGADLVIAFGKAIIQNMPQILEAGVKLVATIVQGILSRIGEMTRTAMELASALLNTLMSTDWWAIGTHIVQGIKEGFTAWWNGLVDEVSQAMKNLYESVKNFFGIRSPSKKFAWIAEMNVKGMEEGFKDEEANLTRTVHDVFDTVPDTAMDAINYSNADIERNISYKLSASGSVGGQQITVPVLLDGREIARATAWSMGQQLAWEEL